MAEHTRTLDFKVAFAIGLGTMIAAGIFSLSGTAVYRIGSSAVIAFVIAALVAGITAAAYSEFASVYSENGGGYLFSSRTFDDRPLLTYGIGASLFLGYTGTTAFYLATMDEWFFHFIFVGPLHALHALPHGTVGVLAAIGLGALNARGTEESGGFQVLVTGAKVAVLFAFIGGAVAYAGPAKSIGTFTAQFVVAPVQIVSVAALAFITFFGFSAIAASAGEIIEPRKTVPRAIAASIVTVTILYALVIVAMVNAPVQDSVLQQGETAMGTVAASFLGSAGQALIVAGAVFSMISASNASILAASGIGSLMGRQGQAPRRFARVHEKYGTPLWSIVAATALIVTLIAVFIGVLPAEGGLGAGIELALPVVGTFDLGLGLSALTGFATLNLLLPLAVVNVALVVSRRRFPDIERGFRVPGVPVVPALGVVANVALVANLPPKGAVLGVLLTVGLLAAYTVRGDRPDIDELSERAAPRGATDGDGTERSRWLLPVAQMDLAPSRVRLAAALADDDPLVQVVNVVEMPDQTPNELLQDRAEEQADRLTGILDDADLDVDYTAEAHLCRDIGFDIVHTAREDGVDRVLMGYPEEHREVTEKVEYDAPCDVMFVSGRFDSVDHLTVGAGGGPHHDAMMPLVRSLAERGTSVTAVSVDPSTGGTHEPMDDFEDTMEGLDFERVETDAATVADGLVPVARERGGVLAVGATRTRRLRKWVFGSTPDRVVSLAGDDVPVIVYAHPTGISGTVTDYLFPVYRYSRKILRSRTGTPTTG